MTKNTKYIVLFFSILFPVLLIKMYMCDPVSFVQFTNSDLGKVSAVIIILLYTFFDYLFGIFACLLIILYYQSDKVENMTSYLNYLQEQQDSSPQNKSFLHSIFPLSNYSPSNGQPVLEDNSTKKRCGCGKK